MNRESPSLDVNKYVLSRRFSIHCGTLCEPFLLLNLSHLWANSLWIWTSPHFSLLFLYDSFKFLLAWERFQWKNEWFTGPCLKRRFLFPFEIGPLLRSNRLGQGPVYDQPSPKMSSCFKVAWINTIKNLAKRPCNKSSSLGAAWEFFVLKVTQIQLQGPI